MRRTLPQSLNVLAFFKRSASLTRQSFKVIRPFWTTRSAILVLIFSTEKPGLSFSTTKPLTCPEVSSRAQMTLISEKVELPIHFFCPLSTHSSRSLRQLVSMPPDAAEPTSGSVRPNDPIFSQRIIGGSQRCFCVSSPQI